MLTGEFKMKEKLLILLSFLVVSSIYSQDHDLEPFMCDPVFWRLVQPKDLHQIKKPNRPCIDEGFIFHVAIRHASSKVVLKFLELHSPPVSHPSTLEEYIEIKTNKSEPLNLELKSVKNLTPLMVATIDGKKEIVQALIDAGVRLDSENGHKETALILARVYGRKEIFQIIQDAMFERNQQQ